MERVETRVALVDAIAEHFPADPGLVLAMGSFALAQQLRTRAPELIAVDDVPPPAKLDAELRRRLVRADPRTPPLAEHSVGTLVAMNALSRFAGPEEVLQGWLRCLRPGGRLILLERLLRSGPLRALQRIMRVARHPLAPEHLTCLMLNAGFAEIGQSWPETPVRAVITSGALRAL